MDFAVIAQRIKEQFCKPDTEEAANTALSYMVNGEYFSDIDYSSGAPAGWPLLAHLTRVGALCACYSFLPNSRLYRDVSVKEKIISCLTFWFTHDFRNTNWWYNDLGVPQAMRMIALYMKDELPQTLLDKLLARLQDNIADKWTGTNRMWFAENVLVKAVMLKDEALLARGRACLLETTVVAQQPGVEGIQPDGSFAQHGMQLYNNGYGFSFLSCITKWIYILDVDGARLGEEAVRNVTRLVLDGFRFMCRYDEIDPHTRSREIVRGYEPSAAQQMESRIAPIRLLIAVNSDETVKRQLKDLIDFIEKKRTNPGTTANKMFYRLDFMSHSRDKFYASTRLVSRHTLGGDVCGSGDAMHIVNGENVLAGLMAYGTTLFLQSGNEYHNIYPLWDWGRLPSVTSPDIALRLDTGSLCGKSFAGGASVDSFGVCGMSFEKDYQFEGKAASFGGRKAVFYFEDELYLMGDRLHTTAPQPFQTTLDQCFFHGTTTLYHGEHTQEISLGDFIQQKGSKLYHNGICYAMRKPVELVVQAESRTGRWSTISEQTPIPEALDTARGDIFTAYIPHIDKCCASYEYAVLPGISEAEAAAYCVNDQFDSAISDAGFAVYHTAKRVLMAAFFTSGTISVCGHTLFCDAPGFVIVRNGMLSLAAPEMEDASVSLTLDGASYKIKVSGGIYRGRTETVLL